MDKTLCENCSDWVDCDEKGNTWNHSCRPMGPQPLPLRYTCTGCAYLKTTTWSYECENDYIDRGTDAHCDLVDKHISSYWSDNSTTPAFCPLVRG